MFQRIVVTLLLLLNFYSVNAQVVDSFTSGTILNTYGGNLWPVYEQSNSVGYGNNNYRSSSVSSYGFFG